MRDPKRIAVVMEKIQNIWESSPDLRFFQLISHLESLYADKEPAYKKQNLFERVDGHYDAPYSVVDLFYLEDDKFDKFLDEYITKKGLDTQDPKMKSGIINLGNRQEKIDMRSKELREKQNELRTKVQNILKNK